jgi:putative DNA primase/helicase
MPVSGDIITDFVAAMREHGLEPAEEIVADGDLHRAGWRRDKPGTRNGAYVLHLNGHPAGFVECFRRGIRFTWSAKGARLSSAQRRALTSQIAEERKRRRREERERHWLLAKQAQATFEACQDADGDHAYLRRKGIETHGLKVDAAGRLVLPLRDPKGTTWSLQTISPNGSKLFLKDGRKHGLFYLLGEPGDQVVIAEGFATAASIHEATRLPVVVAFDCGNLLPVAKAIRGWLPVAQIVIAAGDDYATEGNPGLTKARDAAEFIGATVAVPTFLESDARGTDFNDLALLRGTEAVAEIIRTAFARLDTDDCDDTRPAPDPAATLGPQPTRSKTPAPDDWENPLLEAVEELNAKHFVVTVGGQTAIASLVVNDALKR